MTAIEKYCMNTLAEYTSEKLLSGEELDDDLRNVLAWLLLKEDIVKMNNELSKFIKRQKLGEEVNNDEYAELKEKVMLYTKNLKSIESTMPLEEICQTYQKSEILRSLL